MFNVLYAVTPAIVVPSSDATCGIPWMSIIQVICTGGVIVAAIKLSHVTGRYTKTVDDIDRDSKANGSKLDSLVDSFNRLLIKLDKIETLKGVADQLYFKAASPKALTEIGMKMLQDSGLKQFIDDNKRELMAKVDATKPPTNYDAEQLAINVMLSMGGNPRLTPAKNFAFQSGRDLNGMLMAAGIYLRDMVIKK